jgi:hypothetical protein
MESGPGLQRFFYDLHEDVNERKAGGPPVVRLSFAQVRDMYTRGHIRTENRPSSDREWGSPFFHLAAGKDTAPPPAEAHTGSGALSPISTYIQLACAAAAVMYFLQYLRDVMGTPRRSSAASPSEIREPMAAMPHS